MSIIQMAGVGVVGTLLALQFKNGKNEYAIYTVIAVSLVLFYGMKDKLELIQDTVSAINSLVNINTDYVAILLKMIGITYVAEFATGICKDAGYHAIAGQIEVFGKVAILTVSTPVILALFQTVSEFLA